ncbi:hypothetical protein HAX54_048647 [Datura stramonium]|uniref:Uncharacterized protein n=1 Tax=Datura stramonium TaxID=4076 RepID=A0ABS8WNA1_DATST|nr:hypothetical protein [Datura stramonium]
MRPPIKEPIHFKKKQRRSKKWNLEREEKLREEIRNEAEIDEIPKVRRQRDSSENRVQERIVTAVNGRVPEDEERRDYKEHKERAFAKQVNYLNPLPGRSNYSDSWNHAHGSMSARHINGRPNECYE